MEPTPTAKYYLPLLNRAAYQPEDTFTQPFYEFTERFNSLARYWSLGQAQYAMLTEDLEHLHKELDGAGWDHDSVSVDVDLHAFPETLRLSVLTMGFAVVDELLRHLSMEIATNEAPAENNGAPPDLSFANLYMLRLTQQDGPLGAAPEPAEAQAKEQALQGMTEALDRIGTTILADLAQVKEQLAAEARTHSTLTDDDVEATMHYLSTLVKSAEQSYLEYLDRDER